MKDQKNFHQIISESILKFEKRVSDYLPPMNIKDYIAEFQDFPQQGINFKDISPILRSPETLDFVCNKMAYECRDADVVAALDARGFIFAPMIAQRLGIPWIMIRKK